MELMRREEITLGSKQAMNMQGWSKLGLANGKSPGLRTLMASMHAYLSWVHSTETIAGGGLNYMVINMEPRKYVIKVPVNLVD
uniref:Uncharacterized protein n=1 Tax=Oryza punctata TaxID=4537 RepID=A0A0E0LNH0_ORYPU